MFQNLINWAAIGHFKFQLASASRTYLTVEVRVNTRQKQKSYQKTVK